MFDLCGKSSKSATKVPSGNSLIPLSNSFSRFWLNQLIIVISGVLCFLLIGKNYNTIKYSEIASLIPGLLIASFVLELVAKNLPSKITDSKFFSAFKGETLTFVILLF